MLHFLQKMDTKDTNFKSGDFDILRGAYRNDFNEVDNALGVDQRCISNKDRLGRTALHIAAQRGFFDMVTHLFKQPGADPNIKDLFDRNVLEIAWEASNPELSQYISEHIFPGLSDDFRPNPDP